nr:flagellar biosynthesis protein FlgL [Sulfurimonas sp.]
TAIEDANKIGSTYLTHDGKIEFREVNSTSTQATLSLYDSNSNDFTSDASVETFNSNNSLTIRDPKTDFFKELDEMITAVENYKTYPDTSSGSLRNIGIENSIAMVIDMQDHITRTHSMVGAQSNSLTASIERTELLELSTMTLRSQVIDTDLAEASLSLTTLTMNFEAMLSTVGKVAKLSLVNYL